MQEKLLEIKKINETQITFGKELGKGVLGTVNIGVLKENENISIQVAIKV